MLKLLIIILVSATFTRAQINATQSNDTSRQGREYYYPSDQEKNNYYQDYPPITHPTSNYIPYKDDSPIPSGPACPPSPLMPILNNALQFLLLKLGAIGIIKAFFAAIFVVLLFKLPIILAKAAFLKAVILPILMAPLMLLFPNLGQNMMMAAMSPMTDNKPSSTEKPASGRRLDDLDLYFVKNTLQSAKMFLDSGRCAERVACLMGAWNNDEPSGKAFNRMVKYMETSSPVSAKQRIESLREAFSMGNHQGECDLVHYPCESPQLVLNQGNQTLRVL